MAKQREQFDCQKCGACCCSISDQASFCDLTNDEVEAFSPQFRSRNVVYYGVFEQLTHAYPPAALRTKWMKHKAGRFKGCEVLVCCQLEGSVLHRVKCRIYDRRPGVCKQAVKPGDKNCRWIRRVMLSDIKEVE